MSAAASSVAALSAPPRALRRTSGCSNAHVGHGGKNNVAAPARSASAGGTAMSTRGRRKNAAMLRALSEKDAAATDATGEGAAAGEGEQVEEKDCPYGFSKAARAMDSAKQAVYNALMGSSVPMTKEEVAAAGAAADPNVRSSLPSSVSLDAAPAMSVGTLLLGILFCPLKR